MTFPTADGTGTPIDQGVATTLFLGALLFGVVAFQRLRGRAFQDVSKAVGWGAAGLAAASLILAIVLPPIIRPVNTAGRAASSARLEILSPLPGEGFRGDPASVPVRLRLAGGRIVSFTSTKLRPNEGHIHVYLDGALVSMTNGTTIELRVRPGKHRLEAEFVAVDHLPFDPRVRASVEFEVASGT